AVVQVRGTNGGEGVGRAVHEIGAGAAVDVQVDETGREIIAAEIDDRRIGIGRADAHGSDAPGLDVQASALQAVAQDQCGVSEEQRGGHSSAAPTFRSVLKIYWRTRFTSTFVPISTLGFCSGFGRVSTTLMPRVSSPRVSTST